MKTIIRHLFPNRAATKAFIGLVLSILILVSIMAKQGVKPHEWVTLPLTCIIVFILCSIRGK